MSVLAWPLRVCWLCRSLTAVIGAACARGDVCSYCGVADSELSTRELRAVRESFTRAREACSGCGYSRERCDALRPPAIKCCPDCRHGGG